jgi:transposase
MLAWFVSRPPCLVGMEACLSAHWCARELAALGHIARIIASEFVRPFRLSGKNDANDAAAICAAVRQPQLRFVAVKSAEQQARLVVHRLRQGWQVRRPLRRCEHRRSSGAFCAQDEIQHPRLQN